MLHILTDDVIVRRPDWLDQLTSAAEHGGSMLRLHLRAPHASGAEVFAWGAELHERIAGSGSSLSVNDRVDVAAALGLDVHLGQRSLTVPEARSVIGAGVVGVSCHDEAEVDAAGAAGADYVFVGPARPTHSHPGAPALGEAGVRALVDRAGRTPVIAVGGIEPSDVEAMCALGMSGIAVIRGFWDAGDSLGALASYISALGSAQ